MLSDRDFEYRAPEISACLAPFGVSLLAVVCLRAYHHAGHPAPLLTWLATAAILASPAVVEVVRHCTLYRALARQGLVQATAVGIAVTDGRGKTESVRWEDVGQLWVRRVLVISLFPVGSAWRLRVRTGDETLLIYRTIDSPEVLADTIVSEAGLTETNKAWWGAKYTRPSEEHP